MTETFYVIKLLRTPPQYIGTKYQGFYAQYYGMYKAKGGGYCNTISEAKTYKTFDQAKRYSNSQTDAICRIEAKVVEVTAL